MALQKWIRRTEWVAVVATILGAGAFAQAQDADKAAPDGELKVLKPGGDRLHLKVENEGAGDQLQEKAVYHQLGKYWIGVALRPDGVSDLLRSQLKLPEKGGVVVMNVVPDSPAAKSGLKEYDVILQVGDKSIDGPESLIKAVNDSEGKSLSLTILRGGEKQTLEVTPDERPEHPLVDFTAPEGAGGPLPPGIADMEKLLQDKGLADRVLHWRGRGPAIVLDGEDFDIQKMPGNLKVTIQKEGDGPAKIHVERGDESWDVTEENLDKLPEDIRDFVKKMTAKGRVRVHGPHGQIEAEKFELHVPKLHIEPPQVHARVRTLMHGDMESVQKQLEQMRKEMKELGEQMREMRESLGKESRE